MKRTGYNRNFFHHLEENSARSARVMVPLVFRYLTPKSVLDIGCGTGALLSVFKEKGVVILGVDGPWVAKEESSISEEEVQISNLEEPLDLKRTFDLVVSLEVAEHISEANAEVFVKNLMRHGKAILFSAAIPHQGGTHHINEQWPAYWAALFKKEGYVPIDCLRKKVWNNPDVNFWFAQNILFFVKKEELGQFPLLAKEYTEEGEMVLPLVHPALFEAKAKQADRLDALTSFVPFSVKAWLLKLNR